MYNDITDKQLEIIAKIEQDHPEDKFDGRTRKDAIRYIAKYNKHKNELFGLSTHRVVYNGIKK